MLPSAVQSLAPLLKPDMSIVIRTAALGPVLAFAGTAFALPFAPGTIQISNLQPLVVVAPAAPAPDNPPFTVSRGTGYDGVAVLASWRTDIPTGYIALCTGSNRGGGWILTAAHCVANTSGQNVTTQFMARFFPDGPTGSSSFFVGGGTSPISEAHIDPLYDGSAISDHDMALVKMNVPSFGAGVSTYSIYGGPIRRTHSTSSASGLPARALPAPWPARPASPKPTATRDSTPSTASTPPAYCSPISTTAPLPTMLPASCSAGAPRPTPSAWAATNPPPRRAIRADGSSSRRA